MAKAAADLGGGLTYRVERRNGATWIALAGNVTEASEFEPIKRMPAPLIIDLGGIERINSLGVRNWIYFVRECEAMGQSLTFERVPPVIVGQMSMVSNFMGSRSRVTSVLAPYLCPSCSTEDLQVIELANGQPVQVPETQPCPKCRSAMEFDDLVAMYTELFVK